MACAFKMQALEAEQSQILSQMSSNNVSDSTPAASSRSLLAMALNGTVTHDNSYNTSPLLANQLTNKLNISSSDKLRLLAQRQQQQQLSPNSINTHPQHLNNGVWSPNSNASSSGSTAAPPDVGHLASIVPPNVQPQPPTTINHSPVQPTTSQLPPAGSNYENSLLQRLLDQDQPNNSDGSSDGGGGGIGQLGTQIIHFDPHIDPLNDEMRLIGGVQPKKEHVPSTNGHTEYPVLNPQVLELLTSLQHPDSGTIGDGGTWGSQDT